MEFDIVLHIGRALLHPFVFDFNVRIQVLVIIHGHLTDYQCRDKKLKQDDSL